MTEEELVTFPERQFVNFLGHLAFGCPLVLDGEQAS